MPFSTTNENWIRNTHGLDVRSFFHLSDTLHRRRTELFRQCEQPPAPH